VATLVEGARRDILTKMDPLSKIPRYDIEDVFGTEGDDGMGYTTTNGDAENADIVQSYISRPFENTTWTHELKRTSLVMFNTEGIPSTNAEENHKFPSVPGSGRYGCVLSVLHHNLLMRNDYVFRLNMGTDFKFNDSKDELGWKLVGCLNNSTNPTVNVFDVRTESRAMTTQIRGDTLLNNYWGPEVRPDDELWMVKRYNSDGHRPIFTVSHTCSYDQNIVNTGVGGLMPYMNTSPEWSFVWSRRNVLPTDACSQPHPEQKMRDRGYRVPNRVYHIGKCIFNPSVAPSSYAKPRDWGENKCRNMEVVHSLPPLQVFLDIQQ
jgi:hypothetical protein